MIGLVWEWVITWGPLLLVCWVLLSIPVALLLGPVIRRHTSPDERPSNPICGAWPCRDAA